MSGFRIQRPPFKHGDGLHGSLLHVGPEYSAGQLQPPYGSSLVRIHVPPFIQGLTVQKSVESHRGPAKPVLQIHLFATQTP